jgi:hypothetical protein
MTFATPKQTWPTVLFLATTVWFAIVSLLPVAEQAWRAVAVASSFEPSLDAETARLFKDSGIVIQVRDADNFGTATIGREMAAMNHPLRLDITFDPQQAGEARLVGTEALSRGLGPQCLSDAIEPLVRREAKGGDRTYLASLGVEVVQAAYEADRFGKAVLPRWLVPGMAILCGALAWFSSRLGRMTVPVTFYMPSMTLTEERRRLETSLARIDADMAKTRAALVEQEAATADISEPIWWQRLNVIKQFKKRRDAARALAKMAALREKVATLDKARTALAAAMSRNDRRQSDHRRRFDAWVENSARLAGSFRQAVGALAIAATILATTHATVAVASPGALIAPSRFE